MNPITNQKKSGANLDQKQLDLAYLSDLTIKSVKPLSRVEWELSEEETSYLKAKGLFVEKVIRVALNGNLVTHVVFSAEADLLESYLDYFFELTLAKTPEMIRKEGEFFGFPNCCVEEFISSNEAFLTNNLSKKDQEILYHWACPECKETPKLIPLYRQVWQELTLE